MLRRLRDWLIDPAVRSLDVNSVDFSVAHRQVLLRKKILQELFIRFYKMSRRLDLQWFGTTGGKRLEIGSGAGILNEVFPEVITSDIKPLPFVDVAFRAEEMPFRSGSLRAVYAINVFHHLKDPRQFFPELLRVLRPGGGVILIEPAYSLFARWLFTHLHQSEKYEMDAPTWRSYEEVGPFSNANQALSYIVFKRDRAMFEREFPELEIVADTAHTHLWYIVSGGVNFRQLLPNGLTPVVRTAERLLTPFNRWIALQHTVVLRKRA